MKLFSDLHIHSCLSPCGDRDMTVNNIVNMALIKGLNLIALTDHNSARNCPAFMKAAARAGIKALPGMEICSSEEVHAVCLFRDLSAAMSFDAYVYDRLPVVMNKPEIFGEQLLLDEWDEVVGTEPRLLINAVSISFSDLPDLVKSFSGIFFPAHIDKAAFSMISNLGTIPEDLRMDGYEIFSSAGTGAILRDHPALSDLPMVINSDAHYLWDISEAEHELDERIAALLL